MKTVTGLFETYSLASDAVAALRNSGISSDDISIVSRDGDHIGDKTTGAAEGASVGSGVGMLTGGAGGLLADLGLITLPGIGAVAAAGWLTSLLAGAAAGTVVGGAAGGIIGALAGSDSHEDHAHVYAESLRRGGTLVMARVHDDREAEVKGIFASFSAIDPDERRRVFTEGGWQNFAVDEAVDIAEPRRVNRLA